MPIILPLFLHSSYGSSGPTKFVESYEKDSLININMSSECGVYHSSGYWWIWFKINGNTKYYFFPFDTREEAKKHLVTILNEK